MLSDDLNPVFVLKIQRVLTFVQTHGMKIILGYVILFVLAIVFRFPHNDYNFHIFLLWVKKLGLLAAIIPAIELSYSRINDDLSHFTPLSDKQLIDGYALTSIVYGSSIIALLGLPFVLVFFLGGILDFSNPWNPLLSLFTGTIRAVLFGLFVMSFCAGAKSMLGLGVTGALIFLFYRHILDGFFFVAFMPAGYYLLGITPDMVAAWTCYLLCVPCFAWVAYSLTVMNYVSKSPFPAKHFWLILYYLGFLLAVFLVSFLVYAATRAVSHMI